MINAWCQCRVWRVFSALFTNDDLFKRIVYFWNDNFVSISSHKLIHSLLKVKIKLPVFLYMPVVSKLSNRQLCALISNEKKSDWWIGIEYIDMSRTPWRPSVLCHACMSTLLQTRDGNKKVNGYQFRGRYWPRCFLKCVHSSSLPLSMKCSVTDGSNS